MLLYHVAPTGAAADSIRSKGASADVSSMQGGGFYLWASRAAAEAYMDDPWISSRHDPDDPPVVLTFNLPAGVLAPDVVIGKGYVRDWAKKKGYDFPTGGNPRPSVVQGFMDSLGDRELEELNSYVLRRALDAGGAVKYVGGERIFPVDSAVAEAVIRRLLSLS